MQDRKNYTEKLFLSFRLSDRIPKVFEHVYERIDSIKLILRTNSPSELLLFWNQGSAELFPVSADIESVWINQIVQNSELKDFPLGQWLDELLT